MHKLAQPKTGERLGEARLPLEAASALGDDRELAAAIEANFVTAVASPLRRQMASIVERQRFCRALLNLGPNRKTVEEPGSGLFLFQRIVNSIIDL